MLGTSSADLCPICQQEPALLGDGPPAPCRDCLGRITHAAFHPWETLSPLERLMFSEAHGDVVELTPEGWRWRA